MNSEEIKKLTERSIENLMASMSLGKSESLVHASAKSKRRVSLVFEAPTYST
jgi:hypothetical protein